MIEPPAYLSYKFQDHESFANSFDEMPLWSAAFGLLMFRHLEMKPNLTVLDIGSGTGFPLLELGERLGNSCKLFGIDPWHNANERARQKLKDYEVENVEVIETSAEHLPFEDNAIDLIVSNLGINNFENPHAVFKECNRVLKPKCKLVLTTNLFGHWKEFYNLFYITLIELDKEHHLDVLKKDEEHRGTLKSISNLFTTTGFNVSKQIEDRFEMKFLDGSAFLNHHFVKLGWLSTWMRLFPSEELATIFSALEQNLNDFAGRNNGLSLSVPMAYMEGEKLEDL